MNKSVPSSTWTRPVLWMADSRRDRLMEEWEARRLRTRELRLRAAQIEEEAQIDSFFLFIESLGLRF